MPSIPIGFIEPGFSTSGLSPHWIDLAEFVCLGGIWISIFAWRLSQHELLPLHAPGLEEALGRASGVVTATPALGAGGVPVSPPSAPITNPNQTPYLPLGERGHENSDVNAKWPFFFAVGLAVGAVLMHVVLWVFLKGLALTEPHKERHPQPPADARPRAPPEPRLETNEIADLKTVRLEEEARLTRYEWANKSAGIVRIPIARAMELIEQRGLPDWKPKDPNELVPDAFGDLRIGGKPQDRKDGNEH